MAKTKKTKTIHIVTKNSQSIKYTSVLTTLHVNRKKETMKKNWLSKISNVEVIYNTNNICICTNDNISISACSQFKAQNNNNYYSNSYLTRCIRCIMSRHDSNTLLIFSVSTAVVKCG